jgi:hypothetical protein
VTVDALSIPFGTWQEGLLALADALQDPNREQIIVTRLEATAARIAIGPKEVCTLALLVPSRARFEPAIKPEPHPDAVRFAAMADGKLNETLAGIVDGVDRRRRFREEKVFSAFPESDPRRVLIDTILGFAAAELADVSQRLGEADPFLRLSVRLALWFRQSHDYSRYGIPLADDGRSVVNLVRQLAEKLDADAAGKIRRLIQIWPGDVVVEQNDKSIREIASLWSPFDGPDTDHLDAVLAMEIIGALASDIESLYVESLETFSEVLKRLSRRMDDGRPRTADLRTWLNGQSHRDNPFRLVYDPSEAFWSAMHADDADVLEPLLVTTLEEMGQGGHVVYATGPLPLHGRLFNRERKMMRRRRRLLEIKSLDSGSRQVHPKVVKRERC